MDPPPAAPRRGKSRLRLLAALSAALVLLAASASQAFAFLRLVPSYSHLLNDGIEARDVCGMVALAAAAASLAVSLFVALRVAPRWADRDGGDNGAPRRNSRFVDTIMAVTFAVSALLDAALVVLLVYLDVAQGSSSNDLASTSTARLASLTLTSTSFVLKGALHLCGGLCGMICLLSVCPLHCCVGERDGTFDPWPALSEAEAPPENARGMREEGLRRGHWQRRRTATQHMEGRENAAYDDDGEEGGGERRTRRRTRERDVTEIDPDVATPSTVDGAASAGAAASMTPERAVAQAEGGNFWVGPLTQKEDEKARGKDD